jgi:presenilin-like A22 family membrane protease
MFGPEHRMGFVAVFDNLIVYETRKKIFLAKQINENKLSFLVIRLNVFANECDHEE